MSQSSARGIGANSTSLRTEPRISVTVLPIATVWDASCPHWPIATVWDASCPHWRTRFTRGVLVEEPLVGRLVSVEIGARDGEFFPVCVSGRIGHPRTR
ncbi:hypothetical protein AB0451_11615 [Streptomyces sp. NPDC052000]|uniref:hypothetical protein n=1 Tax=Streptomyces sp. NPDC052000 TaxID=3155676 RepID=UPI00344E5727